MLGIAADRFMLGQMTERVVAHTGNAAGTSLSIPDRERAGTAHVMMRAGQMPGPQNQLSSDYMPGVSAMPDLAAPPGALPGMSGFRARSTLPGMSGLGDLTLSTGTLMGMGAIAAALYYLLKRK